MRNLLTLTISLGMLVTTVGCRGTSGDHFGGGCNCGGQTVSAGPISHSSSDPTTTLSATSHVQPMPVGTQTPEK